MPSKASKLLERARRSRGDWKRVDLEALYKGYGFIIEPGAKHDIVYHETYDDLNSTLPRHRKLQPGYVRQAVKLIDSLLEKEQAEESGEESNGQNNR